VTLVNAGHPSPLLYRRATRSVGAATNNDAAALPLGILDGIAYTSCQVGLETGDCLLAFTDGITEAMDINNVQLQTTGVCGAVQGQDCSPRALGERVVQAVKQFAAARSQHDDIALVGFGRTG
jgi:serine phosphatase RsbU (regulator of sigma subunit)